MVPANNLEVDSANPEQERERGASAGGRIARLSSMDRKTVAKSCSRGRRLELHHMESTFAQTPVGALVILPITLILVEAAKAYYRSTTSCGNGDGPNSHTKTLLMIWNIYYFFVAYPLAIFGSCVATIYMWFIRGLSPAAATVKMRSFRTIVKVAVVGALLCWGLGIFRSATEVFGIGSSNLELVIGAANLFCAALFSFPLFLIASDQPASVVTRNVLLLFGIYFVGTFPFITVVPWYYFSTPNELVRILIRGFMVPTIKSLWVHVSFHVSLVFEVTERKHANGILTDDRFLIFILPVAKITTAGHCLQLAASSWGEAIIMQVISLLLGLSEYQNLLSGRTLISKALERFQQIRKRLCGGCCPAEVEEDPVVIEQRKNILADLALVLGPIEAVSASMMAACYLLAPVNPNSFGGEPIPATRVVILWVLMLIGEQVIPDGLVGVLSFMEHQITADITDINDRLVLRRSDMWLWVVVAFITITNVAATIVTVFFNHLCAIPLQSGSGEFLAFTACPGDDEAHGTITDYINFVCYSNSTMS